MPKTKTPSVGFNLTRISKLHCSLKFLKLITAWSSYLRKTDQMGGMRFTVWMHSVRSFQFETRQPGGECWPTRLRHQNIQNIQDTMARPKPSQNAWKVFLKGFPNYVTHGDNSWLLYIIQFDTCCYIDKQRPHVAGQYQAFARHSTAPCFRRTRAGSASPNTSLARPKQWAAILSTAMPEDFAGPNSLRFRMWILYNHLFYNLLTLSHWIDLDRLKFCISSCFLQFLLEATGAFDHWTLRKTLRSTNGTFQLAALAVANS